MMLDDPYSGLLSEPVPGVDVPNDTAEPISTTDLACEVCGEPLIYAGRGRKPRFCSPHKAQGKSTGSRPSARGDVEIAMQAMDTLYSGITMVLLAVSPEGAAMFAANSDKAQAANRIAFESDRNLVKAISRGAGKTAKPMFAATQIMLIAPVGRVVLNDLAARKAAKVVAEPDAYPMPGAPDASGFVDPVDIALQRNLRR